jgi:hypothetical protein
MTYCNQYKHSFAKEQVNRYLPDKDWWFEMVGNALQREK